MYIIIYFELFFSSKMNLTTLTLTTLTAPCAYIVAPKSLFFEKVLVVRNIFIILACLSLYSVDSF